MATTEFSWNKPNGQNISLELIGEKLKLSDDVLISNIRWFITFRWVLIASLVFRNPDAVIIRCTSAAGYQ